MEKAITKIKSQHFKEDIELLTVFEIIENCEDSMISSSFLNEIKNFALRNRLTILRTDGNSQNLEFYTCSWCLRAYVFHHAFLYDISIEQLTPLLSAFKAPVGHNGYYLDKEEVIYFSDIPKRIENKQRSAKYKEEEHS